MSFYLAAKVISHTTSAALDYDRKRIERGHFNEDRGINLNLDQLSDPDLDELREVAKAQKETKAERALQAIQRARAGDFSRAIPNVRAFAAAMIAYLRQKAKRGWVFQRSSDGFLYPFLVTDVVTHCEDGRRGTESEITVRLWAQAHGLSWRQGDARLEMTRVDFTFHPGDVANRTLDHALASRDLTIATDDLIAEYDAQLALADRIAPNTQFAQQFRFTGVPYAQGERTYGRGMTTTFERRRVIHDLPEGEVGVYCAEAETTLSDDLATVPRHPLVRVFDLRHHTFYWVHGAQMTAYAYDASLRDKLILPEAHRDLLDVLTTDLDAFVNDIIEGKSAGNIILCKGQPGVGKTLTAEVYAELIGRPLYSIHAGHLGTDAASIEKALRLIFGRSARWNCVLLLDEADVFVVERGSSLEQNAVVAEFLRVLEYFPGLLFMTTNRPHDIDEAIVSRCAALITYSLPEAAESRAVWQVMAEQFQAPLSDELLHDLVQAFPRLPQRDIKNLFRLVLRVAKSQNVDLSLDLFRRYATFRGVSASAAVA